MTRRGGAVAALLAAAASAVAASSGSAQDGGGGGSVNVGATVPSLLALDLVSISGFTRVSGGDVYQMTVQASVTSSAAVTNLTVADGEDPDGPAHGHLRDGSGVLAAPLQVELAGHRAQSLSAPIDPLLQSWDAPLAQQPAQIVLRQTLSRGSITASTLHKIVLITVSNQSP